MQPAPIPSPVYSVRLKGQTVHYTIRRSARAKHIRITINAHNGVVVTFPARLRRYINPDDFLREKQEWVLRHLSKAGAAGSREAELTDGAVLSVCGRDLRIVVGHARGRRPQVHAVRDELHVDIPAEQPARVNDVVRDWLRLRAEEVIAPEAERLAARIGVHFKRLTIRDQRTKWGSCSRAGNLSFNWRLVLFPPSVLRYVIVHELCHLKQFNHSPRFWHLVETFDPGFRRSIEWLKEHGTGIEGALR